MKLNIALLGFGSIGAETAQYLLNRQSDFKKYGIDIKLNAIYTRTPQKVVDAGIDTALIVKDWQEIIDNTEINCVVELMGGMTFSREVILAALHTGKHVVTANKALLSHHGKELLTVAHEKKMCIAFEASCGGGIPIIKALSEGLVANTHSAIYGVMNGTCNFILSEMKLKNISFENALHAAMKLGLVEADPSLDIDGLDAGHKIAILSSLAFQTPITMNDIPIMGISHIKNKDIYFSSKLNYTMKLIAAGIVVDNTLSVWVHPALLPQSHPMTSVEGSFNAISSVGSEVGHTLYYGRGAGGKATNSAIIADLMSLASESYVHTFNTICTRMLHSHTTLRQTGIHALESEVYIRIRVDDLPGTLSKIAHVLDMNHISIARVLQEDVLHSPFSKEEDTTPAHSIAHAELIIITHKTSFSSIKNACKDIENLDIVHDAPSVYPIIEVVNDGL